MIGDRVCCDRNSSSKPTENVILDGLQMARQSLPLPDKSGVGCRENLPFGLTTYEEQLNRDPRWAMSEGSRHFEEDSAVFKALHNVTQRLESLGIPYAVVGGMALFGHGLRRFTEDVDILVTKADLKIIHEKLEGLGYLPPFKYSKHLRDTENGVRIEFLTTGDFPGDGKPKPVAFPLPGDVTVRIGDVNYVNLVTLVELKLASGMTNDGRLKDLADVLELIKVLELPMEFRDQLNPYVQSQFQDLWKKARKRYIKTWRNKGLTAEARSDEEMIVALRAAADQLNEMLGEGVEIDDDTGLGDDYALLVTMDAKVAEKFGFVDESEYWDRDDDKQLNNEETGVPPS